jgi:hypothetical protein
MDTREHGEEGLRPMLLCFMLLVKGNASGHRALTANSSNQSLLLSVIVCVPTIHQAWNEF